MNSSTKELFPSELEFASQESNAKDLISVKKRLLCRKHDTLQIQFEQRFKQILEIVLSNFLLHSILQERLKQLIQRIGSKTESRILS